MSVDSYAAGLRVLDIEHGLRGVQSSGIIESELSTTLLLGKAANLGLHLRGLNVVEFDPLRYVAGEIGIRSAELPTVARELAELDWVRLVTHGDRIKRLEIKVPNLRSGFDTIGERWRQSQPGTIEEASVLVLADAVTHPLEQSALRQKHGLSSRDASIVMEIGAAGTYLREYRLDDGEKLIYSPLYSDYNPERAFALVQRYGDTDIGNLIRKVIATQGVPFEHLGEDPLLRDALLAGVVLAPSVGAKKFVFTPQRGTAPEETIVLDKARAILSCVRYGQHYAGITRIFSPAAIIDKLITAKRLAPHSEHAEQYGLLVKKGIGSIHPVGSRWQFVIEDTEDNLKALRTARDLLDAGTGLSQAVDESVPRRIFSQPGSYATPVVERARLNHSPQLGKASNAKIISEISDLIRGARGD